MDFHFTVQHTGFFLIAYGVVGIFFPRVMFFLDQGWAIRDAEPSDLFLILSRVAGIIMILVGLHLALSNTADQNQTPEKPPAVKTSGV